MPLAFPVTIIVPSVIDGIETMQDARGAVWQVLADALRAKGYSCYSADGVLGQQTVWVIDEKAAS